MLRVPIVAVAGLWISFALAQASSTDGEHSTADKAKDEATAAAVESADSERPFKLPPAFYEKKCGKYTLYCKKDASIGTRFKTEKCFDDRQMRDG